MNRLRHASDSLREDYVTLAQKGSRSVQSKVLEVRSQFSDGKQTEDIGDRAFEASTIWHMTQQQLWEEGMTVVMVRLAGHVSAHFSSPLRGSPLSLLSDEEHCKKV